MRNVDQLLEGLEPLILAALDELCALDDQGAAQTIVLAELQHVIDTLQQHCDLDPQSRQRVDEAREMYARVSEVSMLRKTLAPAATSRSKSNSQRH